MLKLHIWANKIESFLTLFALSNSGEEKLQFTPFLGYPKPGCTAFVPELSKAITFFCLRSYPGEISHSNSPKGELSNDISDVVVRRRKVALHTSTHLTPTEVWRSAVSTTWEGRRDLSEVPLENWTRVFGVGNIWGPLDLRSGSYKRL